MTITLPDPEELYDSPVGHRTTGLTRRQFFKKAAMSIGAVVIAASSLSLFNACAPPSSQPPVIQPATISPEKSYRDRVRKALLQDVPELANYKSALDYTTQRVVDMKNVYKLDLDQVRSPVAKWVGANIEWDKKNERLVPFTEEIDYIPYMLLGENGAIDDPTLDKNTQLAISARLGDQKMPYAEIFAANTESIANGHGKIWAELNDPEQLKIYLHNADVNVPLWWTKSEADKYKLAIRQKGTFDDKAHWALVGKAQARPKRSEEVTRNEQPLAYILAVGGGAQIAHNYTVTLSTGWGRGDRQLAIKISKQLEDAIRADPTTYGNPIDSGYLQPNLPNKQAVDEAVKVTEGKISMPVVYRSGHGNNRVWLVGNEAVAKKYNVY